MTNNQHIKIITDIIPDSKFILNLKFKPSSSIHVFSNHRVIKIFLLIILLPIFLFFLESINHNFFVAAESSSSTISTVTPTFENNAQSIRQQLETQLKQLEDQINQYENTIQQYQKQGNTLKNEIAKLNARINELNLKIKAINLNLQQLDSSISDTQTQINSTENKINQRKQALTQALREIFYNDDASTLEILLANNSINDFFNNISNIMLVQQNIQNNLNDIMNLRTQLIQDKQELMLQKQDIQNLKEYQLNQKNQIALIQQQKNTLLQETKGKESNYQKLLKTTRETAAQIRQRIFQLLGGGELTFEQAYNYAKLASQATNIRTALILAILDRESALGKNVGKCKYNQIMSGGTTAMNPKEIPIFLNLLQQLNIDPNSQLAYVSCPNSDGTYGGAMGPAQFLPSTWQLYSNDIKAVTGNSIPNPWNNSDAFVATALYIKDAMNSNACKNYATLIPSQQQILLERCAAAMYYAGNRWYTYRLVYGDSIVQRANQFQQDIDIMNAKS
ncbi:MAG: lytic murein transglycosylase [Minisyncoccia bacterium]